MKCPKCGYDLHIEDGKCRTCRQSVNKGGSITKEVNVVQCPECNSPRVRYCTRINAIVCMSCDHRWKPHWRTY